MLATKNIDTTLAICLAQSQVFTYISSLNPHGNPVKVSCLHPHFTDGKVGAEASPVKGTQMVKGRARLIATLQTAQL